MILTVEDLVTLLRSSVNVQNSKAGVVDSAFLDMTDEELILFIKLSASANYDVDSLEELPEDSYYSVLLLAKIDLYKKLAVMTSPKVDLTADNNNQLKLHQRFLHYMALADSADKEYQDWIKNGGSSAVSGVTSYKVTRTNNHYSAYNYNNQPRPKVKVRVVNVTSDTVDFTWGVTGSDCFGCFNVYVGENKIVDMYRPGNKSTDKVIPGSKEVRKTFNMRETQHRVSGLNPGTSYHLAVFSVERNMLFGYAEVTFTTLDAFVEGDEVNIEDIGG